MTEEKTLYQEIVEAGVPHNHYQSDLYVPRTPQVQQILERHPLQKSIARPFYSDGQTWVDIPFAYDPYWEEKQRIIDRNS